jgi:3-oxoacyl-[acyl-carrier-protein] synthase-1
MSRPRVVITGLGLVTPIGNDVPAVLDALRAQRHGLEAVAWLPNSPVHVAGTIKGFDTRSLNRMEWKWPAGLDLPRETLRSLPPHGVYAVHALEQALAEAKLTRDQVAGGGTGLFCASAGSPRFLRAHVNEIEASGGQRVHPLGVVASISGTLNFNLATLYGIRGAVTGFVSACAASTHALGYAADEIALGRQQRMLVVGAEEPTWESLLPFAGMRALSRQADPALASRPFDVARDGFVGSGGAAALVLESADLATQRGAGIFAELAGWGQSADGHNIAVSEPDGRGLEEAMRRALEAARIGVADVDYVNAHATSTVVGDRAEAMALRRLFAGHRPAISSIKGLTGHTLSMSGALETAISALAIRERFIPGNSHLRQPDPACAGLFLPEKNLEQPPRTILKNSSGFGGSNVVIVLRSWEA